MNRRAAAIALSLAALLPVSAHADTRSDVMAGMAQCAPITDNRAWLDCLYGAAQPMRALLGLPPAPQYHGPAPGGGATLPPPRGAATGVTVAQPAPEFGVHATAPVLPGEHARMVSYKFDADHFFTVALADGQVWAQLKGDTDYAQWSKPASSYMVNITNGFLGSYNLKVAGEPGSFKVLRVVQKRR